MKLELLKEMKVEEGTRQVWKLGEYDLKIFHHNDGFDIVQVTKDFRNEYLPEIFCHETSFFGSSNGEYKREFKIQTTAYGSKNPDEIRKIIAGYEYAIEAADLLNEAFGIK